VKLLALFRNYLHLSTSIPTAARVVKVLLSPQQIHKLLPPLPTTARVYLKLLPPQKCSAITHTFPSIAATTRVYMKMLSPQ
jgi:hypothetical protein